MNRIPAKHGEWIVALMSLALVLLSLFPLWASYAVSVDSEEVLRDDVTPWTNDAFSAAPRLAVLLAFTVVALVLIRKAGIRLGLGVAPGWLYIGLGGASLVLLLV
ncbi:MAG TPA: hypothetical protein VFS18_01750, partial [Actinomycetota bacterium]|nr:hypothetical protein [Actinomycetota bacterium]